MHSRNNSYKNGELTLRLAQAQDIPQISALMRLAIEKLQVGYLTEAQIRASHAGMGLDTQLIEDGTYFCVRSGETLVGCGGWSDRATLYGGNHTGGRDSRKLDPASERARIRAMYTHPDHARRGIGRLILEAAEEAARKAGFQQAEMAATLAGEPFYLRCGYVVESRWEDTNADVPVPLLTMVRDL
jgi:GNAT superfamily N-acetyltransferase